MLTWVDRTRYLARHHGFALGVSSIGSLFYLALDPGGFPPPLRTLLLVHKRFRDLLARDLEDAERGYYPRDLIHSFALHEWAFHALLEAAPQLELLRILRRQRRNGWGELPEGIDLEEFPPYYRRAFHWQTDGWLSDRSARLYDAGVEFVFAGTAEVMRRRAIPPLVDALRPRRAPRILDVGCGTGRFLAALHRASPRARLYGVDMSPHYAARARRALADAASILVENAESLPLREGSFDAASAVFLLHELPPAARRNVLREVRRVLEPGGTLAVLDSIQRGDPGSRGLEYYLEAFPRLYHEPFYRSYQEDDLAALLEECGFEVASRESHYFATLVVARSKSR